ncbi:MFS transporter [Prauserella flavalba]|uniref:MFS transporter n=1 Tax=Prauserella flavalba TaxID=1477506 RepID=A0A318LBA6_9PSEU|nr:MFS transporter [Prauserella flavalba]PXY18727.1 MFS transporter [Prauserella flavalba]
MTLTDEKHGAARRKDVRRVVVSSYLGSTIEFYDFILYATASSVVFGPVFFTNLSPGVALIASYATFAIGYLSRPLGGILFGHFGDRIGRKRMLILSMTIMGVASFLVGLVPAIPTWGALMLIVLRAAQGIAVGGEWGGAALMSLEHADGRNRGLAAAFANAGGPTGALLGTVALSLAALLPKEDFLSWGWRIPFLLSVVLLVIGLFVRARVSESPLFEQALAQREAQRTEKNRMPLVRILRRPKNLLLAGLVVTGGFVIQALFSTFGVNYAAAHGVSESMGLSAFAISQFLAIFAILGAAWLSDRIGRRPVMRFGLIGMIVLAYPAFLLIGSGNAVLVVTGFVLSLSLCQSLTFGPMAAFVSEQFGTGARYTGASLGYQIGSLLGAGFTPVIVASLAAAAGGSPGYVIGYLVAMCVVSLVTLAFVAETKDNDLGRA